MHRKPLPALCSTFLCEQTLLLLRATCCWFRCFSEKTFLPSCLALAYVHLLSCGDAHFWSIYSTSKRSPWCQGELWSQMLSAPLSSMKPSAEHREGGRKDSGLKLKLRWSSFLNRADGIQGLTQSFWKSVCFPFWCCYYLWQHCHSMLRNSSPEPRHRQ